ncbi:MAG: phosphonate ABC transporter, permease protein PhnE, partial [Rhodospirillaceae bacterium]|nr:phosphonate ABC transporter, permease protein PhnE [Rhodospirillaceae bacterium]
MPIVDNNGQRGWQRYNRRESLMRWAGWLATMIVLVWCWQKISEGTEWSFVLDAPEQGADILGRMIPPDWAYFSRLIRPLWDTLTMATVGTLFAIMF